MDERAKRIPTPPAERISSQIPSRTNQRSRGYDNPRVEQFKTEDAKTAADIEDRALSKSD